MLNSDFNTQLANKRFELSHSCTKKMSPKLYKLQERLILEAAQSKVSVCGHSLIEIADSNPTRGMDVCLLWVMCVVS
jgi:hypothetical protein